MKYSRLALTVALIPTAQVFADTNTARIGYQLPGMVITSARQAERRELATAANTVFTRDDIERLQARSVPELLRRVPGVSVSTAGGLPSLSVRGTGTAQTLVLLDGQRISSSTSGFARLDYLAIDNIDRVEIIRGPRSALYGADAVGGVIQVFTRGGAPGLHPEVRLAVGSDQTFQRSINLSTGTEQTRVHLGASLNETAGFDITRDGQGADSDHDGQRNRALHLKLDHELNRDWKAGLSLNDQRGENEYDDAYEFAPASPQDEFRLSSFSGYLDGQLGERWNSRLELGRSFDRNKVVGAASDWNNGRLETTRHSAAWINRIDLTEGQQLALGSDWHEDRLDATTAYEEDSRDNLAFFAQHSYQGERFGTELGVRHDDNQQFGSQNSWNAALSLPVGDTQRWILSYGEGFRAPTFSDLYYPGAGNPDLGPETSKTYELQWRGDFEPARLEVALYRTDVEDMIAWDGATNRPENIAQARINGFEASVARELLGWQASLALSLIDPRDRDSGHTLVRRAKRILSLDVDRTFGTLSAGASWHVSSARYDDAANTQELSGYGVVDLRAGWQSHSELRWEAKLNNLFDRGYALATYDRPTGPSWMDPMQSYGYREAGRTVLFAVTWSPSL